MVHCLSIGDAESLGSASLYFTSLSSIMNVSKLVLKPATSYPIKLTFKMIVATWSKV
jgi:hypothetical protein